MLKICQQKNACFFSDRAVLDDCINSHDVLMCYYIYCYGF